MLIRDARPEDAAAVAKVHVDGWRTAYRGIVSQEYLDSLSYEKRRQGFLERLRTQADAITLVAEESGLVFGMVLARPNEDIQSRYVGQIYAIYLLEEHRRRGAGRALVEAVCRRFIECGILSMIIWVLEANEPARAFYERLGGRLVDRQIVTIGRQELPEVAYGWEDISTLAQGKTPST
jgi:ribosomal protein S18 acetylase RimI-like enzyme